MTIARSHARWISSSSDVYRSTAAPARREVAEQLVDLGLRPDVDAAGRVEAEERPEPTRDPARDRDLLLIAAGQAADLLLGPRVDLEPLDRPEDTLALGRHVDRSPAARAGSEGQRDVLADRPLVQQGLGPIGRDVDDAETDRVGRVPEPDGLALDERPGHPTAGSRPDRMPNSSSWPWPSSATRPSTSPAWSSNETSCSFVPELTFFTASLAGSPAAADAAA